MIPNRLQRCLVSFQCLDEQLRDLQSHRSFVPLYPEEVTNVVEVCECETEARPHYFVQIEMRFCEEWKRVQAVLQETSREKGSVEASTTPSHDHIVGLQPLEKLD